MATLGTTITRVLDELDRTDLSAQASEAILSAIKHYQTTVFPFAENRATLKLTASQEYFQLPSDFLYEHSLRITVNNSTYPLLQRDYETLEELSTVTTYTGRPYEYAIYQEQLRLYPIPDSAYTLTFSYVRKLDALTSPSSTNDWLDDVEELIRNRAEWDLCMRVIRDYPRAQQFKAAEKESLEQAISWRNQYIGTGKAKAYGFT